MSTTHISSSNGYHRQRLLYAPYLPNGNKDTSQLVILDIRKVIDSISRDKNLWIVRDALEVKEIIESLIEEKLTPREYPEVMDIVSEYVDKSTNVDIDISSDTLLIASMQLEHYQLLLDAIIQGCLTRSIETLEYEVKAWLGDTCVAVAVRELSPKALL